MSAIKTIDAGGSHADGLLIGQTGEKLAFLGATPIVQRVGAAQAAVTATSTNGTAAAAIPGALTSTDGTAAAAAADLAALAAEAEKIGDDVRAVHAAALLAQAETEKIGDDVRAVVTLVNELRAALVALGAIKGAA